MAKCEELDEGEVVARARIALGLDKKEKDVKQGTSQTTTFNMLGFGQIKDKPDGWYIPKNKNAVAILLEAKSSDKDISAATWIKEIKKNCSVLIDAGYKKVVGLLHNGYATAGFFNNDPIDVPDEIQRKSFYINLVNDQKIDKQKIFETTKRINDNLHFRFGIDNLYHRMIFTACALVAERFGADLKTLAGRDCDILRSQVVRTLSESLAPSKLQNSKLKYLEDVYKNIELNHIPNQNNVNHFIEDVCRIADSINSNEWRGEDVMGIFFQEFNRYKKKASEGQVFTPEHITSFMYRLINVTQNDYVGDFCCGSGGFLVKSMANMMKEAGGYGTSKAKRIRQDHLFGIEKHKEIYALACANMLIHKDGKTNLEHLDMTSPEACAWVRSKPITKVLMNPPYERASRCMDIVENVLDSVKSGTDCAFILPDKKLEKTSAKQIRRLLSNHRIVMIVKLPEPLFFGIGVTTSVFVFKAGEPQNNQEIFGCYIEKDGLETVKNQGRQDIRQKWQAIEDYWVDSITKRRDRKYHTDQWIRPDEHLSYQMPEKPFEISEEDFRKTAVDYICFKRGIDTKLFGERLTEAVLYRSEVTDEDNGVNISIGKEDGSDD
ncbi:MAG: SAM-dependent DNA methyltransferase [Thermoguttaceae bacterium]|nr:SAM-dependent DNA methyltransferase [Thermoguttaceae bacterium]